MALKAITARTNIGKAEMRGFLSSFGMTAYEVEPWLLGWRQAEFFQAGLDFRREKPVEEGVGFSALGRFGEHDGALAESLDRRVGR